MGKPHNAVDLPSVVQQIKPVQEASAPIARWCDVNVNCCSCRNLGYTHEK